MENSIRSFAGCSRCEALPERADRPGILYMWFPLGHTMGKAMPTLIDSGCAYEIRPTEQCVTIDLSEGDGRAVLEGLGRVLSHEEQQDTKALFMKDGHVPGLKDYASVTSLAAFLTSRQGDWLIDMLAEERFTSYFQPIVHTQDPGRLFAHEALFRGFDPAGAIVPPNRVFSLAKQTGLLFQLDLQARRSAIRQAAQLSRGHVFINFNPSAIYDATFCLRSTLKLIDELGLDRRRIVFEVVESDQVASADHLASILDFYREKGFKVALDDLGAGYASLNLVHQLKPDFIKLDMELVRGVHEDPYKAVITSKLIELAGELNIETIAEGVETPEEMAWLRETGATYVQGYLIAKPAPVETLRAPAAVG